MLGKRRVEKDLLNRLQLSSALRSSKASTDLIRFQPFDSACENPTICSEWWSYSTLSSGSHSLIHKVRVGRYSSSDSDQIRPSFLLALASIDMVLGYDFCAGSCH